MKWLDVCWKIVGVQWTQIKQKDFFKLALYSQWKIPKYIYWNCVHRRYFMIIIWNTNSYVKRVDFHIFILEKFFFHIEKFFYTFSKCSRNRLPTLKSTYKMRKISILNSNSVMIDENVFKIKHYFYMNSCCRLPIVTTSRYLIRMSYYLPFLSFHKYRSYLLDDYYTKITYSGIFI